MVLVPKNSQWDQKKFWLNTLPNATFTKRVQIWEDKLLLIECPTPHPPSPSPPQATDHIQQTFWL